MLDGLVILPTAFSGDELFPEAWTVVQTHLNRMRRGDPGIAFAVRSSAVSEDSARASFAGEFESVLDVATDEAVREAIHTVRRSRHGERVRAYSEAQNLGQVHEMAIVVQRLVRADVSGVLFTADLVTGSHTHMLGNLVHGLGGQLVSGGTSGRAFALARPLGKYSGPPELKRFARRLYRLASRLEETLGGSQDIEWAVKGRQLYLLQARPITTLQGYNPTAGEWNDSLTGDYLWSNTNVSEAVPDVMTPSSWSLWRIYHFEANPIKIPGHHLNCGNIGGLDVRLGWTRQLPAAWNLAGALVLAASLGFGGWAMITNAYFSTAVRIQSDRDQTVCRSGPYRFVRHPGYLGFILQSMSTPLLLGSLWALSPGITATILMVIRTILEERMLQAELPGYPDYVQEVRCCLVAGVW